MGKRGGGHEHPARHDPPREGRVSAPALQTPAPVAPVALVRRVKPSSGLRIGRAPLTAALLLLDAMERAERRRGNRRKGAPPPPELGACVDYLFRLKAREALELAALLHVGRDHMTLAEARRYLRGAPGRLTHIAMILGAIPCSRHLHLGAGLVGWPST